MLCSTSRASHGETTPLCRVKSSRRTHIILQNDTIQCFRSVAAMLTEFCATRCLCILLCSDGGGLLPRQRGRYQGDFCSAQLVSFRDVRVEPQGCGGESLPWRSALEGCPLSLVFPSCAKKVRFGAYTREGDGNLGS